MSILNFVSTDATLSMPVSTYEALLDRAAKDERKRIIDELMKQRASMIEVCDGLSTDATKGYLKAIDHSLVRIAGEQK